jgi:hypothetical protein
MEMMISSTTLNRDVKQIFNKSLVISIRDNRTRIDVEDVRLGKRSAEDSSNQTNKRRC